MQTLQLELGDRSYPIHIGTGLLRRSDLLIPALAGRQVAIVTDSNVAPLYGDAVLEALAPLRPVLCQVPAGEGSKTLAQVEALTGELLAAHCERSVTLIALGGGVVGDLTGFTAACYQRGVAFVQIPTTLLAQVDSAVGGKTAVNHPAGKNMIGAFHQPRAVLADLDALRTLPAREHVAGLAEVIKYGLIADADFFAWLEEHLPALMRHDTTALGYAVARSCAIKADIVRQDERESGLRALLNYGHTYAHAFEAALGYSTLLHGEAVGLGMRLAADLSVRLGRLAPAAALRIGRLLSRAGLPDRPPMTLDPDALLALMATDKKAHDGKLRMVVLDGIGHAAIADAVPAPQVRATLHPLAA